MEGIHKVTRVSEDYATVDGKQYVSQRRFIEMRNTLENELNKTCALLDQVTKENDAFRVLLGEKLTEETKND